MKNFLILILVRFLVKLGASVIINFNIQESDGFVELRPKTRFINYFNLRVVNTKFFTVKGNLMDPIPNKNYQITDD